MKRKLLLVVSAAVSFAAAQQVSIPWDEFKSLYRDRIEKEVLMQNPPPEPQRQTYAIEEAVYRLTLAEGNARGEAIVSGRVISGIPAPIPLFDNSVVITAIETVTGGSLVPAQEADGTAFLPDTLGPFQLVLEFLAVTTPDSDAQNLVIGIPRALRNTLHLELPDHARVLAAPGILGEDGAYHFTALDRLALQYLARPDSAAAPLVDAESFSVVRSESNRIVLQTLFQPMRPLPESVWVIVPEGATLLGSNLPASCLRPADAGKYELAAPRDAKEIILDFAIDAFVADSTASFQLPALQNNVRQSSRFLIEEPEDAQLTVEADELVRDVAATRLNGAARAMAAAQSNVLSVPTGATIHMTVNRFESVATPSVVVDAQYVFCTIEDNGTVLTTLIMEVPSAAGPRLRVAAIPDAEIWSTTVNGAQTAVYRDGTEAWIVPLAADQPSHVQLSFLRKNPALGLQGVVDAIVPATGLAARELRVAIALPPRVELLLLEGPVSAAQSDSWNMPPDFSATRYAFAQAFYNGKGLAIAASYKEPIEPKQ